MFRNNFGQRRKRIFIKRDWAQDIELPSGWDIPCKIAKHRIYNYWSHPELIPCDDMGIRIPAGFCSFKEKYQMSKDRRQIFCFGGSTTMGFFCKYEESYPHYLECLLENAAVFNFGLGGYDFTGSMYLLLDLLRLGYVPDLMIFLDGINEKQAWFQSLSNSRYYEETSHQYGYFRSLISQRVSPTALGIDKKQNFICKIKKIFYRNEESKKNQNPVQNPFRFVREQSEYYMKTKIIVQKLATVWNIKEKFFLQPILWDVWKDETNERYTYIKLLYKNIVAKSGDIVDLSENVVLQPSDFIDWQHLFSSGNKILAEAIAKEIKR